MDNQTLQPDPHKPKSIDIWQKFKNKKFIFISLGVILIVFLAVVTFIPEKYLEDEAAPAPTPTPRAPRVEDQVILKFKEGVTEEQINEKLKQYNATIIDRIDFINRIVVKVPKGQGDAMLEAFQKDNLIEDAEPNYIYKAAATANDPGYVNQWSLKNTGQTVQGQVGKPGADINVEAAWDITRGSGIKIAILDTGIDASHPDLSSKIGFQGDFTNEGINDVNGHGTHVAGIAAAVANNSTGIAGICPECQLMIAKVLKNDGTGTIDTVAKGVISVADNGAKVINMSFATSTKSSTLEEAVKYAWDKGAVIVAPAGNNNAKEIMYPAGYGNMIPVGATDSNDQKASFSQYGSWIVVVAPGVNIYSTLPGSNYSYASGTSESSAIVSGVIGLIWASSPGASNTVISKKLCDTADKIAGTLLDNNANFDSAYSSCGRVNAGRAVGGASAPVPNPATGTPPVPNPATGTPPVPNPATGTPPVPNPATGTPNNPTGTPPVGAPNNPTGPCPFNALGGIPCNITATPPQGSMPSSPTSSAPGSSTQPTTASGPISGQPGQLQPSIGGPVVTKTSPRSLRRLLRAIRRFIRRLPAQIRQQVWDLIRTIFKLS